MNHSHKLVLVIHHDAKLAEKIKAGLRSLGISAASISSPQQLGSFVQALQISYLVIDLLPGSDLEISYLDWIMTPGASDGIPSMNLRAVEFPGVEAVCQAVALEIQDS